MEEKVMEFYRTAYNYLIGRKIKISNRFLRKYMQSHPDYPALVSLTDTLEEVGIEYQAVKVDKSEYVNLDYPLLVHGKFNNKEDFLSISSPRQFEANNNFLFNQWDGISLMVSPGQVKHADEELIRQAERKKNRQSWFGIGCFTLSLIGIPFYHLRFSELLLVTMGCLGMFICSLIILKSIGFENAVTEKLCSADDDTGCEKVLQSPVGTLFKYFGLGDLGWVYFSAISGFLILSSVNGTIISAYHFLVLPFTTGILLSFLSFWYQWKVVKQWCKMCLITAIIVWLQLIFLLFILRFELIFDISKNSILLFFIATLFSASLWLIIKPLITNSDKELIKEILLFKWRRDPKLFLSVLNAQRKLDVEPWLEDINTGNVAMPISIVVCAGPYCTPCARTHKILDDILIKYPTEVNLTFRFAIRTVSLLDRRTKAVLHILDAAKRQPKDQILHLISNWYQWNNLDKFSLEYNTNPSVLDFQQLLTKHIEWSNNNMIKHTPAIL